MTERQRCAWCQRRTYGHFVTVNGKRYCHEATPPTCYEKAKAAGQVNLFVDNDEPDTDGAA